VSQVTFAVGAIARRVVGLALESKKRGHRRVRAQYHGSAWSPVASGWTALGPTFRPHKRSNPRTTVSGAEADSGPVNEHDRSGYLEVGYSPITET
jgi:hypothetical protein